MATQVSVRLENGETLTGSTEEWLVALLYAMPDHIRTQVAERLRTQLPYRTSPQHYVLKAEPGRLGLKL